MQYCEESGSMMNGWPIRGCRRTGSDVRAVLRAWKDSSSFGVQTIGDPLTGEPLRRLVIGNASFAKSLMYRR
jgi:hypothetical protein